MTAPALTMLALGPDETWSEAAAADTAWFLFADPATVLHPSLPALLRVNGADRPDVDVFYGDEVHAASAGAFMHLCKPEFDLAQLVAHDYIGLPLAVRARAIRVLCPAGPPTDPAAVYGLVLRAVAAGRQVGRITEVLGLRGPRAATSGRAERMALLAGMLAQEAPDCFVRPGLAPATVELCRRFDDPPPVTILIPTAQAAPGEAGPMILGLLDSLGQTDWPMDRLHVLVGDDAADSLAFEGRRWPFRFERVAMTRPAGTPFNYALKMNRLWRMAGTEHVVMMNDDMLIRDGAWLQALMCFAVDEGVGGVGGRLLYPNGTIQHAGMPGGVMGPCTHAFITMDAEAPTYGDWAVVQREWSMVTGALFATRRSVLDLVNGFDERYTLDYNDADLCLRLRLLGLRIVYTPHAELIHLESATRTRSAPPPRDTALFMEKWGRFLSDDPSYHPRLVRDTPLVAAVPSEADWWRPYFETGAAQEA